MQLLYAKERQQKLIPSHVVARILPIRWHSKLMQNYIYEGVNCEILYSRHDLPKGTADLRCRIELPVKAFAADAETEFLKTLLLVMARVYRDTVQFEIDFGSRTFKPFDSTDEFGQVHKGEGGIKE